MDATVSGLREDYSARRRNAAEVSWARALPMWRLRATLIRVARCQRVTLPVRSREHVEIKQGRLKE